MEKTFVNPETVAPPVGSYSHAVTLDVGDATLIFVSGQIALDRAGQFVGAGDMARQAEQVFENIKAILEANGAAMNDVVKVNTYLTDVSQRPALAEVRARYFTGDPPASTLVEVSRLALEGLLIEVEVTAAIPRRQAGG